MLAASRGTETWARTVRVPVYTTDPPPDGWRELCRAELDGPVVWFLAASCGEIQAPINVGIRVRSGNGQTVWTEQYSSGTYDSWSRFFDLWIPARSVEVDVMASSEYAQPDIVVTGSLAPWIAS